MLTVVPASRTISCDRCKLVKDSPGIRGWTELDLYEDIESVDAGPNGLPAKDVPASKSRLDLCDICAVDFHQWIEAMRVVDPEADAKRRREADGVSVDVSVSRQA